MFWWLSTAYAQSVPVADAFGIDVDGVLDEAAWSRAQVLDDFKRFQPVEGGDPPGRTETRFLQDDKNLYIGVRVSDAGYPMRARVSQREAINADDQVGIYLDTFLDGISGYIFYFNPLGIQQDIRHNAGDWNTSWDTLLTSRGRVVDDGFELEIAIPWRSLRFPSGGRQDWGLIVTRKVPHEGAKYSWPRLERGNPLVFQQEGRLTGMRPPGAERVCSSFRPSPPGRTGPTPPTSPSTSCVRRWTPASGSRRICPSRAPSIPTFRRSSPTSATPASMHGSPSSSPSSVRSSWMAATGSRIAATPCTPAASTSPCTGSSWADGKVPCPSGCCTCSTVLPCRASPKAAPGDSMPRTWGTDPPATPSCGSAPTPSAGATSGGSPRTSGSSGTSSSHQIGGADFYAPMGDRWFGAGSWLHSVTGDDVQRRWGTEQSANLWRASGIGTGGGLFFVNRSPHFRKETGYLTQADLTTASGWLDHTFTPGGAISTFAPTVWSDVTEEGNGDGYRSLGTGQTLVVRGIHSITTNGWLQRFVERGITVNGAAGDVRYRGNFGRALDLALFAQAGRVIDYVTLVPATTTTAEATVTLRPIPFLRTDTTVRHRRFVPDGSDASTSVLVRNRMNLQFSRALGMRWVLDYSTRTDIEPRLFNSLLLTWLENPGTAVYLGASVAQVGSSQVTEGSVFAKATWLIRP